MASGSGGVPSCHRLLSLPPVAPSLPVCLSFSLPPVPPAKANGFRGGLVGVEKEEDTRSEEEAKCCDETKAL